jgi:hypothetical protein
MPKFVYTDDDGQTVRVSISADTAHEIECAASAFREGATVAEVAQRFPGASIGVPCVVKGGEP